MAQQTSGKPKEISSFMKKRTKNLIFYCIMIAFPVFQFCYFYLAVNFNSILLAFKSYDVYSGTFSWVGTENFERFFDFCTQTRMVAKMTGNSLIVYAFNLIVGIPLALFFSYYIYKKFPAYGLFKVMLFLPSIISSIVMVVLFKGFVEEAIPEIVEKISGKQILGLVGNHKTVFPTVIFYAIWVGFGSGILMYSGAMSRVPDSVVESAKLDGISPLKEFWYITLPLIYGTLSTYLIVGVAGIFTNQLNLYSFFGNKASPEIMTFGYYLFSGIAEVKTMQEYPYYAATGLLLTFVAVPLTLGVKYLLEKFGPETVEF